MPITLDCLVSGRVIQDNSLHSVDNCFYQPPAIQPYKSNQIKIEKDSRSISKFFSQEKEPGDLVVYNYLLSTFDNYNGATHSSIPSESKIHYIA